MKSKVYSFCLTRSIAVGFRNGYSHVSGVVSKFHHHFRHLMAPVAIFSTPYNPKSHVSDIVSKFHHHFRHIMAQVAIFSTPKYPKKSCFRCGFKFSPTFQASNGACGNIFNSIQPQKVMFQM